MHELMSGQPCCNCFSALQQIWPSTPRSDHMGCTAAYVVPGAWQPSRLMTRRPSFNRPFSAGQMYPGQAPQVDPTHGADLDIRLQDVAGPACLKHCPILAKYPSTDYHTIVHHMDCKGCGLLWSPACGLAARMHASLGPVHVDREHACAQASAQHSLHMCSRQMSVRQQSHCCAAQAQYPAGPWQGQPQTYSENGAGFPYGASPYHQDVPMLRAAPISMAQVGRSILNIQ